MTFFSRFKKGKGRDSLERPPKGAFSRRENPPLAEKHSVSTKELKKEPEKEVGVKAKNSELGSILISRPHITEKSTDLNEKSVYVFRVGERANKILIKQAVKELYGFSAKKIRILNMPSKSRFIRGKKGMKPGYKKALVYLEKGSKIDLA